MRGLNHYLSGMAEYDEVVYQTNVANGYLVPGTQLLESPSALLEDSRFRDLLNTLAENYRFVIIDTPPLGSVSDSALILPCVMEQYWSYVPELPQRV